LFSGTTTFWSGLQKRSYTKGNVTSCSNGAIHVLGSFLELPQNFSFTYAKSPMIRPSPFADADVVKNGSAEVTAIDDLSNVTIFLPVNYAFKEIGSVVKNWTIKDLQRVMSYHIINDVLPPDSNGRLPLGQYTALDGSKVSIADYEGDQFINNARIVGEYNWVFRGGLIYTIFGYVTAALMHPASLTN
jgi:hypothetical protein